ncbi:AAA family ATPase [Salinarchaeum sp. IM2453]|uniref:AAA family ATPase n=1 Tax=Salinarchaeum sp. IM2453 TaxID=2862870 RepID=UPI001C8395B8|nr:AAA family ATPase [Salinarchaeum sp. IM2453]QZA89506.1 AAA family ATPase [Salinarchaeum sp. IM2453]
MVDQADTSLETTEHDITILHIGPTYLSSSNVSSKRRPEFRNAFRKAIDKALDRNVDAVVQTGKLWATRRPSSEDIKTLRSKLEELQKSGIQFIHAGSERDMDMDMDIPDKLERDGLIKRPLNNPAIVGSTAIMTVPPGDSIQIFDNLKVLNDVDADNRVVAGPFSVRPPVTTRPDFNIDEVREATDVEIDTLLLDTTPAQTSEEYTPSNGPDVYVAGPTEAMWRKSKELNYPCTVGLISGSDRRELEIDRDPFAIYYMHCPADVSLGEIKEQINTDDEVRFIRLLGEYNSESVAEERLYQWLESKTEIYKIKDDRDPVSDVDPEDQTNELTVSVKHRYPENEESTQQNLNSNDMSDIDSVEIYVCGQGEGENQSTCQECFTRELFGYPENSDDRDTQPGDILVLYDYGNKNISGTDDKFIYGPFYAESEVEEEIVPEAWDGEFPNQVQVSWDQLYRLSADEAPVRPWGNSVLEEEDAQDLIDTLTERGTKVQVTQNGNVESIEEVDDDEEDRDEEDNNENEPNSPDEKDEPEGIRDIVELREIADPLPHKEVIRQDPNPGAAMIRPAVKGGEPRPEIYDKALVHLVAGKNVIFYGPPGSGKTRIAERLSEALCSDLHVETANAEWTNQDVVGGYRPENNGFTPTPGILTKAAASCVDSLTSTDPPHPQWLLIDELNRANLDEAFGEVFTLLDLSHRENSELEYADGEKQAVPLAFRILGTMNSEDQSQLFALGYAFRRRFAFVEVPPVYQRPESNQPEADIDNVNLDPDYEKSTYIVERAAINDFDHSSPFDADSSLAIPYLEDVFEVDKNVSEVTDKEFQQARQNISPVGSDLSFDRAIHGFVQKLDKENVAAIGQGIVIDAYKYIIVYHMLFPDDADWSTVDQAVVAYILPQIEPYMSELRRSGTVAAESEAEDQFKRVIEYAEKVGFVNTKKKLEQALNTHEIIG